MVLLNAHLQGDLFGNFIPGNIVSDLNSKVYDFLRESENFSTLFLGMLNSRTGVLTYSDAGHGLAFIYRDKTGDIEQLQATTPPLGIQNELIAVQQEVGVNPGDILLVLSDGIIEARSPSGERFGKARLIRVVRQNGGLSPNDLRDAILTAVAKFSHNSTLADDLTILIVHRRKTPEDHKLGKTFKASGDPLREWTQGLTSDTGILVPLHEWVAGICSEIGPAAEHEPFLNACQLGVSELVTNVIKHAYRGEHGRIEVQAFQYPDRLEFIITDQGLPYETGMLDTEHLPTLREGRYGLMITKRVMDEVIYTRSPRHENVWRLTKRFEVIE
jgi:anti-sigma regulatory factor (Ser/Thr protein kinase)